MKKFSELLKEIRAAAGISQAQLAQRLGTSTVLITMIETGQKRASRKFIMVLAQKLGVHPASITPFTFTDEGFSESNLSSVEKWLLDWGDKMQKHLIQRASQRLK